MSARAEHARTLFAPLGASYDRVGATLSFGQDPRWRRFLVSRLPVDAGRVLDVATGTGLVAARLHDRGFRVTGLDQSPEMLARARARLENRVELVEGSADELPFADAAFDHLTFTYLLRYVDDPAATLAELARVVRPGGTIAMLEFGLPRRSVATTPGISGSTSGCRSPAGSSRRAGTRSAASSAPRFVPFTRRIPRSGYSRSGTTRGSTSAACAG